MPALVHLSRLGYSYLGKIRKKSNKEDSELDRDTNIHKEIFKERFRALNPQHASEAERVLQDIRQELDNDDLGRGFYKRLTSVSPVRLIDFENIDNNTFHFTAELTCERDEENFRPDITLFVNGLPLVFIEVKRPKNQGGMVAESERMNRERFPKKKFRRFINITQFMIFSNNMEYDTVGGIVPIQGAFYSTIARDHAPFNCFREENPSSLAVAPYHKDYPYRDIDPALEKRILSDFNCQVIYHAPEYKTNLNPISPTNRVITSMCSPERLLFLLRYSFAYVKMEREVDGKIESSDQKHMMRYQQLFASYALLRKIKQGVTSGVIWHTQGSGKTALAYYLNPILTHHLARENKVAKFYFIVDRLDLLEQASQEFEARGLVVKTANSRAELMAQFRDNSAQGGVTGAAEITVVNIQRFAEDKAKIELPAYATNLQRIFIIDEAHRGYKPEGSFLANLFDADPNAIKIALTGTPLLRSEQASWKVFGHYLHTYYYDKSIQDGYTLKIIREDIETSYREKLTDIYSKLDEMIEKKDVKKHLIIEHENYVKELLRYIITDLTRFRQIHADPSLGGMIICETSEQARKLHEHFHEIQAELQIKQPLRAGLIHHDSEDKETRKQIVKDFKKNHTVDLLIVYNMLLTGFDAPRLKRLYFGRKLKDHSLLQALTRVNRPYKNNRYGYVIDFADIKQNFEQTNEAYLQELTRFNDTEQEGSNAILDTFSHVIEDKEALIAQMREVKEVLFHYTTDNLEEFSSELATIEDKAELLKLKKVLCAARDCCNIVRTFGDDALKAAFQRLDLPALPDMIAEVQRSINNINQKEFFNTENDLTMMINDAMIDIQFSFNVIGKEELQLIGGGVELTEKWRQTIRRFTANIDPDDPEFITLRDAFRQRFKEHGFVVDSIAMFNEHAKSLDEVLKKLTELQKRNNTLVRKYKGDVKFARVHKRIREENTTRKSNNTRLIISSYDEDIFSVLTTIKTQVDQKVYDRNDILKKDAFFEKTVMQEIAQGLDSLQLTSERADRAFVQKRIAKQYLDQYHATFETTILSE